MLVLSEENNKPDIAIKTLKDALKENDINFDTLYASKRQKKLHFKED